MIPFLGDAAAQLAGKVVDTVKEYFPPDMSEEKKAEFASRVRDQAARIDLANRELALKEMDVLNRRIADLEGTAKDLRHVPVVGHVVLFLRGCQRPVWGFATLYFDYVYFIQMQTGWSQQAVNLLWIVNFLVLGFLFGERVVQNVLPLATRFIEARGKNEKV